LDKTEQPLDFGQFLSYIASGTVYTVGVTLIALPAGLLIGTILALLYVYGGKVAARVMNLYSTIFRGIPPWFCCLSSFSQLPRASTFQPSGQARFLWGW